MRGGSRSYMTAAVWPDLPGCYEGIDGAQGSDQSNLPIASQMLSLKRDTAIRCGIWIFRRCNPKADCRRQPRVSLGTHATLGRPTCFATTLLRDIICRTSRSTRWMSPW
jgi:hypothetical protein